jgi:flagellar biosynthesis protein FlhA
MKRNPFLDRVNSVFKNTEAATGFGIIFLMMLIVIPLNAFALDLMLVLSLAVSLGILLLAVYTEKALEFSAFPSVLLIVTFFRLALNVASTRLILSEGHTGTEAAGKLIHAFGAFIVKGNYVVGLIVFIILVIINFVVITKGSGRVSEVAARFTLDAMPGKQMSIDADLNAGIINEGEAQRRRKEIEAEADFYGAMDGASKFVRGDAIAGILVTVVNIIGGLIIGVAQKDLDLATAAANYTLLTVGDGLVAQVPALIVSTAAGLIVTRASSSGKSLGKELSSQFFLNERILYILSGSLFGLGIMLPGAFLPFFVLSVFSAGGGYLVKSLRDYRAQEAVRKASAQALDTHDKEIEAGHAMDTLQLEVGYGLISIVEGNGKGDLLERIQAIRKQFAQDLGVVVPTIAIRDNLQLKPGEYVLLLKGAIMARGDLLLDHYLAMDPGGVSEAVDGIPCKEPVFDLDALWIHENSRELAQLAGYTVVDLATVIATHITEKIREFSHELVGRQEVQALIEQVQKTHPKVVDEVVPKEISLGILVRVLQNLLKENVPIRDLVTILESIADAIPGGKDPDQLTEAARTALARSITRRLLDEANELPLVTFSRELEEKLIAAVHPAERGGGTQFFVDPSLVRKVVPAANRIVEKLTEEGISPILLVTPMIRLHVKRMLDRFLPHITVLSHNEIQSHLKVRSVGTIDVELGK